MKKIVALGAIAALAGGMIFADEPAIDMKVAEFNGNATVKWGMDLDAGQHGFDNSTGDTNLKVNLWNEGTKATEGDGIWGEIEIKGKGLTVKNGAFDGDGTVSVEKALIHLGDKAYIGIKSGDTQVGAYKFDGAIRSADNDNAKWLSDVGPANFTQGIVLGYGDDNFGIDVDFRSYYNDAEGKETHTHYTSAYGIAAEAKLKDSNEFVSGLALDAGVAYNLTDKWSSKAAKDDDDKNGLGNKENFFGFDMTPIFKALIPATDLSGLQKAYDDAKKTYEDTKKDVDDGKKTIADLATASNAYATAKANLDTAVKASAYPSVPAKNAHTLGYSFNAGYKFEIDDTYYVKPAVGFTGTMATADVEIEGETESVSSNSNSIVAGVLFGWGANADANAGVPFLDGDGAKKVTPGISVVAAIPLPTTYKTKDGTLTYNDKYSAIIVPSVYLGDLVENLKFGAYSEIGLLKFFDEDKRKEESGDDITVKGSAEHKDRTMALALAAGVAYDIKSDDLTITPKAGIRYANTAYTENGMNGISPLSNNKLFEAGYTKMGLEQKANDKKDTKNFFNLKAGVDVNGLIANTTLFAEYASANLLNDQDYSNDADNAVRYNVKNGTFNIGAKIHF